GEQFAPLGCPGKAMQAMIAPASPAFLLFGFHPVSQPVENRTQWQAECHAGEDDGHNDKQEGHEGRRPAIQCNPGNALPGNQLFGYKPGYGDVLASLGCHTLQPFGQGDFVHRAGCGVLHSCFRQGILLRGTPGQVRQGTQLFEQLLPGLFVFQDSQQSGVGCAIARTLLFGRLDGLFVVFLCLHGSACYPQHQGGQQRQKQPRQSSVESMCLRMDHDDSFLSADQKKGNTAMLIAVNATKASILWETQTVHLPRSAATGWLPVRCQNAWSGRCRGASSTVRCSPPGAPGKWS